MFAGFAVSIQLAFAVLMLPLIPVMMILGVDTDTVSAIPIFFDNPIGYFKTVSPYIFVLSIFLFVGAYYAHTALTKLTTGFRYIHPGTNVRLYNITRYLAVTAGIQTPSLGVISSPALNSFACGRNATTATIVVTQGLLNELNDDELRAVIAHEIVHIMNGDVQLMAIANASQGLIKLINWLNPLQMRRAAMAKYLLFILPIMIPIILMLALFGFVMKLSLVIASVSRYFITSSREFIADAEAVRLTHNPAALISALSKIEGRSEISGLDPMTDAMMIDGRADGEYASHPPIQERIQTLMRYGGNMVHGAAAFTDTRSFGQRRPAPEQVQYMARTAYREKTKKPLLERIDAGSTTNIFGLPKAATGTILAVFGVFFFVQISARTTMNSLPGQLSEEEIRNYVQPVIEYSPVFLAIDLDGDGLETRRRSKTSPYFKMSSASPAYKTGWLESDDGFLFLDRNRNGKMDGMSELITTTATRTMMSNKMSSLTVFDANRDGQIDPSDYQYQQLLVWRDFGRDGIAEADEVFSLAELNITSLDVKGAAMEASGKYTKGSKRFILASNAWLLRRSTYSGQANNRFPKDPANPGGNMFLIAFEIDLARYKKANGTLVVKAPSQTENAAVKKAAHASDKIKPSFEEVGPMLRGLKP